MNSVLKIQLKNVCKAFDQKQVLQGVDLDIKTGESIVVMGGSGTGKSVMLKCLLGLIKADMGQICVDGIELVGAPRSTLDSVRAKISMLFQGAALFDSLPIWENIFFQPLQKGEITAMAAYQKTPEKLAAVGLPSEIIDFYPAALSGGMQRRVGIARAVAAKPEIILFDEPTAGLDPIISGLINQLIVKNVKELGATALTITHDLASARCIADRIAMLHQGKIIWQGTVAELDQTDDPYITQFIKGEIKGPINIDKI